MTRRPALATALFAAQLSALVPAAGCRELEVIAVDPSEVSAGFATEVSVIGRGFDTGLSLSLSSTSVEVSLAPVDVFDPSLATGRVPPAAPPGVYDVVAELDGASATLVEGLRVVAGEARVTFIDVGQGDATLVVAPSGEALLVDGGASNAGDDVREVIARETGGRLDAVVLSHFDADHLAGLVEVLAGEDGVAGSEDDLRPDIALGPSDDGSCATGACSRMRLLGAWPFDVPSPGDTFALGEVEVEVVAVDGRVGDGVVPGVDEDNERSVAVVVRFGGRSLLITGDLTGGGDGTADVEAAVSELTGHVDVLRVSHHGSITSSSPSALSRWTPRASVFSFGTDNAYCHPHPDVVARIDTWSYAVYATGLGVVDDLDRCPAATVAPPGARFGLGDVLLRIGADGAMVMADDEL